ncbi:TIGR04211 family SH3 domain-containing protein, partial [Yersinia enterocolitica]
MQKLRLICLTVLSLTLSLSAYAEEKRYISDELDTYVHSGPGNQYRIVGTLKGGDEVTLISVNDGTNYGQIRDSKGKTTWIPLDQLSETPSLRVRVPDLEQQVKT